MQKLFDTFIDRLPMDTKERLRAAISHQNDLNPNDRLQKGTIIVLEEVLKDQQELEKLLTMKMDVSKKGLFSKIKGKKKAQEKTAFIESELVATKQIAFQIASLSCYLTQQMKATVDYKLLLKKIDHPYIEMFLVYFNENPTNYKETRETVEQLSKVIEKENDFTLEMKAYVIALRTWVYGQQGDIAVLKEGFKYITTRLPQVDNIVESRGLEDASTNCIWWMLHSGVEANIEEMIDFIEPYILKNQIYQSYTDFLNLKGATVTYFGKNEEGIKCFEDLMKEYENVHDNYRLSIAIGNLAEVYFETGQIMKAKDMMERAITLYKKSTGEWPYLYLTEIGNIYYVVGDPRAEESFLHAYEIQRKEKSMFKAFIMFELIHYYLRSERIEKAKQYLGELESLAKELEILSINAQVTYLLGYSELLNQNFSNAIRHFQRALELASQSKDNGLILSSNIQLTAVYLQRYRLKAETTTLNLALNHIEMAIKLAQENQHNQILAIGLTISSILRAAKGVYKKAQDDLDQAKEIMNEIDYDIWKQDLANIEQGINKASDEGQMVLDTNSMFKYVSPQLKSILSFKLMDRKQIESEIIGLLIISESGVPILSKLKESVKTNQLILSGLLTAINHLSESIIEGQDKGRLREVLYDEFWIAVQPIKNGLVAVIATEATAEIRLWANVIADRVVEVPIVISEFTTQLEDKIKDLLNQMNIK